MSSKSKNFRYKYLSESISIIFVLKKLNLLHYEIAYYLEISKSFETIIFYWEVKQLDSPSKFNK